MTDDSFRTIQSLGRSELIGELMENATVSKESVVKGVGDDAAVIATDAQSDSVILLTSESFLEGVDFDLTYTPLHHLGYKTAASVISDIYAMNGTPETMLVNLALPNKLSVDMVKDIYRGIFACGEEHDFQVVGGDLTASHNILAISMTCHGKGRQKDLIFRTGAREGDAVCVTGDLGGAIAGLRILMREKQYWEENEQQQQFQPDLDEYEYVVGRQLVPAARKDFIELINREGLLPSTMIDLTQGLVSELSHITDGCGMGALIYQAALPIALETRQVAEEMKEDVDKYALYGGEDLEMLFTLSENRVEDMSNIFSDFTVIGKISADFEGPVMQTGEGEMVQFRKE